jgi:hypothetical protein
MMLDIRTALRTFLLADASIAAIVGDRVRPVRLNQGETGTGITYLRVSGIGDHVMTGPSRIARPRFQIDCWAEAPGAANSLADLVKERLDGYQGLWTYGADSPPTSIDVLGVFFENERDGFDSDNDMYSVSRDYFIWYREMND